MEFGRYLNEKGYKFKKKVRTDEFTHITEDTYLGSTYIGELGGSELEYNFKVLKRNGIIVPKNQLNIKFV